MSAVQRWAAFTSTNVTPGQTGSRRLRATSRGTAPATEKIYTALGAAVPNDISPHITITIQEGTRGTITDCSSFTRAADVIWATNSAEFYLLLVRDRG